MAEGWELFVLLGLIIVLALIGWGVWALIRSAVAAGVRKGNRE